MDQFEHVLPGEQGETGWFDHQNPFEQETITRQVAYKRAHWPGLSGGRDVNRPKHSYSHIFPAGCEYLSVYESIALELFDYLSKEDIVIHSGIRNLKSSQAACFNILFPMKQDLNLAKSALNHFLPNAEYIEDIEFEYTGPPEITQWLGEPTKGRRGQNRTSIDAAVFWKDQGGRSNISLVEWKYTEKNFGTCSMYSSKEHRIVCDQIDLSSGKDPALLCPLSVEREGNSRRYWEHLKISGISRDKLKVISGCPFRTPFYQIMRQCEVAAYLRKNHVADIVEVMLISFSGNTELLEVPTELQPLVSSENDNIISIWNNVLSDVSPVRHVTVEQIMQQVDLESTYDQGWREYLKDRYGI